MRVNSFVGKLKDVLKYLGNPQYNFNEEIKTKDKFRDIFVLYIFDFLIVIVLSVLIRQFLEVESSGLTGMKNEFNPLEILLFGITFVPIFEELVFRLWLVFKPLYLGISITLFSYLVLSKVFYQTGIINIRDGLTVRLSIAVSVGLIFYFVARSFSDHIRPLWGKKFRWVYYFSVLLFGLMHMFNYDTSHDILLLPILTLPQMIGGIFNGYVRVKYGFFYGVFLHSIYNLLPMLGTVLL